jgi:hypothetical protein
MKKAILAIMVCVGFCTIMKAQVPLPPTTPSGDTLRKVPNKSYNPPISPATLLLLGLGASTVGYRVYRNQKQKND